MLFPSAALTVQDMPALSSLGEKGDLVAVLTTSTQGAPQQSVEVSRGGKVIFTANAGMPSPVLPLQGLWTYDGHWVLEILLADANVWAGEIFLDGELVNRVKGYDEAFGFQLLAGKPFFFYQRNGHVGVSYDGREADLNYDQVPHYRCCSEGSLNPIHAQNMVAFFAQRGQDWYYVELGDFGA